MDIEEIGSEVSGREGMIDFLRSAASDLTQSGDDWENATLQEFLEAWAAWLQDTPGWFANRGEPVPSQPSWDLLAKMVLAARVYE
ncbi:hypothetical protein AMK23_21415 [Streptomyces sp. CB02130]|uniref:DUF7660 family protein n=1 Tax=Streptomyces sp. CB02130 TaxID=1703934 RepID=UPI00093B9E8B|nr:hypothetical protein [Streptomyces sp. CB02130]OKJ25392.1 hypothetical protein AMK23_21415 [Streptomyces sp. CB02130]